MSRLIALLALLVLATSAEAAGLQLNQSDPHLGQTVTFSYIVPPKTEDCTRPQAKCLNILVMCFPVGAVHTPANQNYAEIEYAKGNQFLLGGASSLWLQTGGQAECDAQLYTYKNGVSTVYATTAFTVLP